MNERREKGRGMNEKGMGNRNQSGTEEGEGGGGGAASRLIWIPGHNCTHHCSFVRSLYL